MQFVVDFGTRTWYNKGMEKGLTWTGRILLGLVGVTGAVILSSDNFWVKAGAVLLNIVLSSIISYNIGFNDGMAFGVIEASQLRHLFKAHFDKIQKEKEEASEDDPL